MTFREIIKSFTADRIAIQLLTEQVIDLQSRHEDLQKRVEMLESRKPAGRPRKDQANAKV